MDSKESNQKKVTKRKRKAVLPTYQNCINCSRCNFCPVVFLR